MNTEVKNKNQLIVFYNSLPATRLFFLSLSHFSYFNYCFITSKFTLKKKEKLKSRKRIQQLFKDGKRFSYFPFRVIYIEIEKQDLPLMAGFTVSTSYFKHAVDRNRVKRLMREAFRLQKANLINGLNKNNKQLSVFFIYTSADLPKFEDVFEKMRTVLERIENLISGNN